MAKFSILIFLFFIFACETKKAVEQPIEEPATIDVENLEIVAEQVIITDSVVITEVVKGINFFDYRYRRWRGVPWEEYEYAGNSDTAVTLHTYQLLTSSTEPDFEDWATFTNLYERRTVVKIIVTGLFSNENDPNLINIEIDNTCSNFMKYAKEQVKSDMEKYGQSDGPYYDLVERFEK